MSRKSLLKVAMLAVAGAAMSADAQVTLFTTRPHCQSNNNGTTTSVGFSSGNIGAGLEERWAAAPFSLNSNSTVTQLLVVGFVPAGSEFSNLAWKIWSRAAGNPAPTLANLIASGEVPYVPGVDDPQIPGLTGTTWMTTININPGLALNAGNYYLTVYGKDPVPPNTTANFAWFGNSQLDPTRCPANTPIPLTDAQGSFMWRAANFTTGGFQVYRPATLTVTATPAWGPTPQDPLYLWNHSFTVIGNGTPPTGACCTSTGSCTVVSAEACCGSGGLYQGNGTACGTCPQPGACCKEDGSCEVMLSTSCASAGGLFRGANKPCGATAACFKFGHNEGSNDAGALPATAQNVSGMGQPVTIIRGEIQLDDIDMYKFRICDESNFGATTVGAGNTLDSILCLFNSTGRGVAMSDDTVNVPANSTITSQFVTTNGLYYLAMSTFNNTALQSNLPSSNTGLIWVDHQAAPQGEWAPDGPGAADPVTSWTFNHDVLGTYAIKLTGSCFLGCYADCDGSGGLTANDFQCFLDSYANAANGTGYANCDRSTGNPSLTANDFQCFINSFAGGCPNP